MHQLANCNEAGVLLSPGQIGVGLVPQPSCYAAAHGVPAGADQNEPMPQTDVVDVSVVVPAYNEESRLGRSVDVLIDYFRARETRFEIVLVDDGSRDSTLSLMRSYAAANDVVKVASLATNRGKGRATAIGVAATRGAVVLTTDADLSTPINEFDKLLVEVTAGAHIAIASRADAGSVIIVGQPVYRVMMGRVFNRIVQLLLLPGINDTQCGFKLYQGPVARGLFACTRIDGFAFDVEVLLLARRLHHRIAQVPVHWENSPDSRVSPARHSLQMLRDLLRLRLGLARGPRERERALIGVDQGA
jgi:dolichyl-phosphate beta-glucosyltransferase